MKIKNLLVLISIISSVIVLGANNKSKELRAKPKDNEPKYTIEQAISQEAQLKTTAFSGLAFITGSFEADSFFPPGKVADFFGFQYMRDVDKNGMGHNTNFLTRAANNMLYTLNDEQKLMLKNLAKEQVSLYDKYALGRLTIIKAFRVTMEKNETLNKEAVLEKSRYIYSIDAELSYARAVTFSKIINSFTIEQKSYLDKMNFDDSNSWPNLENQDILGKKSYTHEEDVAMMTYASELFSWYKGSVYADTYICPERIANYFGGFYMKDYPAMGNSDYYISTTVTGDSGEEFLNILTNEQKQKLELIVTSQTENLKQIMKIREDISNKFRSLIKGEIIEKSYILNQMSTYGTLEGTISYNYAVSFREIYNSLTKEQKDKLYKLRNLNIYPKVPYKYSEPLNTNEDFGYQKLIK